MSKEIRSELKKLSRTDKAVIGKMMSYLYSKSINQFELENMHAEIVGMAAEGALRGESLEMICGPDYKKFCDELSANCLHKSKREVFLEVAMILSITCAIVLSFVYSTEFLFDSSGQFHGFLLSVEGSKLLGMSLVPAFCGGLGTLFYMRNSFSRKGRTLVLYILLYFVTYFCLRILTDVFFGGEITINVILAAIVTIAVFLFSIFTKKAIASSRMRAKQCE